MKFPSLNNSNQLAWKCKLFGCRDEYLPLVIYDKGEKHGIKGWGRYSATETVITYTFTGCRWCDNYTKMREEEVPHFPKWECSCDICDNKTQ